MRNFDFYSPTYFVFGKDREAETGRYVKRFGGSRVLVVYGGQSSKRSGLLDRVKASLDAEGICRLDGIEGNCRMVSTGVGSLPAYCHDVLEIYCRASRTARNYDAQGRWLGWDLVPDTVAPG